MLGWLLIRVPLRSADSAARCGVTRHGTHYTPRLPHSPWEITSNKHLKHTAPSQLISITTRNFSLPWASSKNLISLKSIEGKNSKSTTIWNHILTWLALNIKCYCSWKKAPKPLSQPNVALDGRIKAERDWVVDTEIKTNGRDFNILQRNSWKYLIFQWANESVGT